MAGRSRTLRATCEPERTRRAAAERGRRRGGLRGAEPEGLAKTLGRELRLRMGRDRETETESSVARWWRAAKPELPIITALVSLITVFMFGLEYI
jgi:hypothetical protein